MLHGARSVQPGKRPVGWVEVGGWGKKEGGGCQWVRSKVEIDSTQQVNRLRHKYTLLTNTPSPSSEDWQYAGRNEKKKKRYRYLAAAPPLGWDGSWETPLEIISACSGELGLVGIPYAQHPTVPSVDSPYLATTEYSEYIETESRVYGPTYQPKVSVFLLLLQPNQRQ